MNLRQIVRTTLRTVGRTGVRSFGRSADRSHVCPYSFTLGEGIACLAIEALAHYLLATVIVVELVRANVSTRYMSSATTPGIVNEPGVTARIM